MTKKKFYDEYGNEVRSRPPRPFYKKWRFGMVVILGVTIGAIGIYILGNEDEIVGERIEQELRGKVEVEKTGGENQELKESSDKITEEQTYTYEDFKGIYVAFEGEPYNSPVDSMKSNIIVLGTESYQSFNRWDFDMTSIILDKTVKGNILTLDLESSESVNWGLHSESGTEQFELRHDGDKKTLYSITNDHLLYSMSNQDLQTHYSQSEIDYARIIMTIYGEPSLDQWLVWNNDWGIPVVNVSYNSAGDSTEVSNEVYYPENVTHLDFTRQGMAAGIITYSSHGDGHITRYPMPLHYQQEDQSENGYEQLAKDALGDAYTLYVEPFEPYTVADFIGRIKFVYE